jgi:hypothetical protein
MVPLALVAQLPPLRKQLKSPALSAVLGWVLLTGADWVKWNPSKLAKKKERSLPL